MHTSGLPRFLLVTTERDRLWKETVTSVLEPLGKIDITNGLDEIKLGDIAHYDLIIIDSFAVQDIPDAIRRIRITREAARVVVATHSPTWRRARDAFRAGAVDYIRKSLDPERTKEALMAARAKTPLPFTAIKQIRR